jgi:hypothetical protein
LGGGFFLVEFREIGLGRGRGELRRAGGDFAGHDLFMGTWDLQAAGVFRQGAHRAGGGFDYRRRAEAGVDAAPEQGEHDDADAEAAGDDCHAFGFGVDATRPQAGRGVGGDVDIRVVHHAILFSASPRPGRRP